MWLSCVTTNELVFILIWEDEEADLFSPSTPKRGRHPWQNLKEMLWSRCRRWRTQEQLKRFTVGIFIVAFLSEPVKGKPLTRWLILPLDRNLRTARSFHTLVSTHTYARSLWIFWHSGQSRIYSTAALFTGFESYRTSVENYTPWKYSQRLFRLDRFA